MKVFLSWLLGAFFVMPIFLIAHIYCVTRTYNCPSCGTVFRAKWYEISTWYHTGDKRVAKCPHCKRRGFCKYR